MLIKSMRFFIWHASCRTAVGNFMDTNPSPYIKKFLRFLNIIKICSMNRKHFSIFIIRHLHELLFVNSLSNLLQFWAFLTQKTSSHIFHFTCQFTEAYHAVSLKKSRYYKESLISPELISEVSFGYVLFTILNDV